MRDVLDDCILEPRWDVTVPDYARHVAFPQPSGEPREMTITRQRIALHVAENEQRFVELPLITRTKARDMSAWNIKELGGGCINTRTKLPGKYSS